MENYITTRRFWSRAIGFILVLVILLVGGCSYAVDQTTATPATSSSSLSLSFAGAVDNVMESVVYLYVQLDGSGGAGAPSAVSGSGVILREDGYILTNRHVVEGAKSIQVTLQDRQSYDSTNSWLDSITDLAVVKIRRSSAFPAARHGDPGQIRVGDWVMAVGYPLGLSPREGGATVTAGIVSNLGRSLSLDDIPYYDIVQTDAAINSGNSGGPLINTSGEVIGINSLLVSDAENIGFAINIATARHVFEDLVKYGKPHHPYLGVSVDDVAFATAVTGNVQQAGAVINGLDSSSPAAEAGLRRGDIIKQFDADQITSAADLLRSIWRHEVGDAVNVTYSRSGIQMDVQITLGNHDSASDPSLV